MPHVPVIATAGEELPASFVWVLRPDPDRSLADVERTETADQAHAVHLAGLLLEPADQQHIAIGLELELLAEIGNGGGLWARLLGAGGRWFLLGDGHDDGNPVADLVGSAGSASP